MARKFPPFAVLLLAALLSQASAAQTSEWQADSGNASLGEIARSLRKQKAPDPASGTVIDNDNLSKVMDAADHQRLNLKPVFSVDSARNQFRMSSPDGSCSLSFNAEAASLISVPYAAQDLPDAELAKLDGPATIHGNTLQVSVFNGSSWNLKEITVGLTIVRQDAPASASYDYGAAKLIPASQADSASPDAVPGQKRSDSTVLYHLKGWAASLASATFEQNLDLPLDAGQEWHWAIVQARGTPPQSGAVASSSSQQAPAAALPNPVPSTGNPR